jgi:hypothetical protein
VFHWKLRMTRVMIWLQFKSMWEMARVTIWLQIKSMWEMARARIQLQFNLCENSQIEDLIAIQSLCNTKDLGLCLKTITRGLCGSRVWISRDWRTKWRGCKVQSGRKCCNSQTQELCPKQLALMQSTVPL